jgi:hypothetical protein
MVVAKTGSFGKGRWTHVCFTWSGANSPDNSPGEARLYLDSKLIGVNKQVLRYSWQPEKAVTMLGIYYVGMMDELATFDTALSDTQVKELFQLNEGLAGLISPGK